MLLLIRTIIVYTPVCRLMIDFNYVQEEQIAYAMRMSMAEGQEETAQVLHAGVYQVKLLHGSCAFHGCNPLNS